MARPDGGSGSGGATSVEAECVAIAYRRRLDGVTSNFFVAAILLVLGWNSDAWPSTAVLVGLLLLYAVGNFLVARAYIQHPRTEQEARRWGLSLYPQIAVLGLLYNVILLNLARHGAPHALDLLMLITVAYSAGGSAKYQHLRGLAATFVVFAIGPQILYYLVTGARGGWVVAALLTVFVLFMIRTGLELHGEAVERIRLTRALQISRDRAEQKARIDVLTELFNRRALYEAGAASFAASVRHGRPLSVFMLDLDHFKRVNDELGHAAGDAVLRAVAETLRREARGQDLIGRIGGEEFVVVLPDTTVAGAVRLAERVRQAMHVTAVPVDGRTISVTASLGITERVPEDQAFDDLLRRADEALYAAKASGRDRVEVWAKKVGSTEAREVAEPGVAE